MDCTPDCDGYANDMSGTASTYGAPPSTAGVSVMSPAPVDRYSGLLTPTASKNYDGGSDSVSEIDHTEGTKDDRFEEAWRGVL
jgi:hypothetical protein